MASHNPWHDVSVGDKQPQIVNAIIEISKDSNVKYEVDKETGMLCLDRFLYSPMHYPGDYGFIPQTYWDDGDPLDIIILSNRPVLPLTLVRVRVLGVLRMIDGTEKDDKVIGVYDCDPRYAEYQNIEDVPKHVVSELRHFFERYKELQGKTVKVLEVLDRDAAFDDVKIAMQLYADKFSKKKLK